MVQCVPEIKVLSLSKPPRNQHRKRRSARKHNLIETTGRHYTQKRERLEAYEMMAKQKRGELKTYEIVPHVDGDANKREISETDELNRHRDYDIQKGLVSKSNSVSTDINSQKCDLLETCNEVSVDASPPSKVTFTSWTTKTSPDVPSIFRNIFSQRNRKTDMTPNVKLREYTSTIAFTTSSMLPNATLQTSTKLRMASVSSTSPLAGGGCWRVLTLLLLLLLLMLTSSSYGQEVGGVRLAPDSHVRDSIVTTRHRVKADIAAAEAATNAVYGGRDATDAERGDSMGVPSASRKAEESRSEGEEGKVVDEEAYRIVYQVLGPRRYTALEGPLEVTLLKGSVRPPLEGGDAPEFLYLSVHRLHASDTLYSVSVGPLKWGARLPASVPCGVVAEGGAHVIRLSRDAGELLAEAVVAVRWPALTITPPTPTSSVVISFNSDCKPVARNVLLTCAELLLYPTARKLPTFFSQDDKRNYNQLSRVRKSSLPNRNRIFLDGILIEPKIKYNEPKLNDKLLQNLTLKLNHVSISNEIPQSYLDFTPNNGPFKKHSLLTQTSNNPIRKISSDSNSKFCRSPVLPFDGKPGRHTERTVVDRVSLRELFSVGWATVSFDCQHLSDNNVYSVRLTAQLPATPVLGTSQQFTVSWVRTLRMNVSVAYLSACAAAGSVRVTAAQSLCHPTRDKLRVFAVVPVDVASVAPPTLQRYVGEYRVGREPTTISCSVFTEGPARYCFAYIRVASSGAVTEVARLCRPTLRPGVMVRHGAWSGWSGWSDCVPPCGEGRRFRFRTCDSPAPMNRGDYCKGNATAGTPCINPACDSEEDEESVKVAEEEVASNKCSCGCQLLVPSGGTLRLTADTTGCPNNATWIIQCSDPGGLEAVVSRTTLVSGGQWLKIRDGNTTTSPLLLTLPRHDAAGVRHTELLQASPRHDHDSKSSEHHILPNEAEGGYVILTQGEKESVSSHIASDSKQVEHPLVTNLKSTERKATESRAWKAGKYSAVMVGPAWHIRSSSNFMRLELHTFINITSLTTSPPPQGFSLVARSAGITWRHTLGEPRQTDTSLPYDWTSYITWVNFTAVFFLIAIICLVVVIVIVYRQQYTVYKKYKQDNKSLCESLGSSTDISEHHTPIRFTSLHTIAEVLSLASLSMGRRDSASNYTQLSDRNCVPMRNKSSDCVSMPSSPFNKRGETGSFMRPFKKKPKHLEKNRRSASCDELESRFIFPIQEEIMTSSISETELSSSCKDDSGNESLKQSKRNKRIGIVRKPKSNKGSFAYITKVKRISENVIKSNTSEKLNQFPKSRTRLKINPKKTSTNENNESSLPIERIMSTNNILASSTSELSMAGVDLEFDYYDYDMDNASAVPGSLFGLDPTLMPWLPSILNINEKQIEAEIIRSGNNFLTGSQMTITKEVDDIAEFIPLHPVKWSETREPTSYSDREIHPAPSSSTILSASKAISLSNSDNSLEIPFADDSGEE